MRGSFTGMGAAVLVNGSIILAAALSPLVVEPLMPVFVPKPVLKTIIPPVGPIDTSDQEQDALTFADGQGGDDMTGTVREIIKTPVPVFKLATRDLRFAQNFQPDHPGGMLRRETEESVTTRTLIGFVGRVKPAQVVSATDPDFARAAERQAYQARRFKPATRDHIAVEDWQTLTVRFDIN